LAWIKAMKSLDRDRSPHLIGDLHKGSGIKTRKRTWWLWMKAKTIPVPS